MRSKILTKIMEQLTATKTERNYKQEKIDNAILVKEFTSQSTPEMDIIKSLLNSSITYYMENPSYDKQRYVDNVLEMYRNYVKTKVEFNEF